jgi:hypothetical protein
LADESPNIRFLDRHAEGLELLARAFRDKLDPAISEIPHPSSHFKALRHHLGRVPKTHPLNPTRVIDGHPASAHAQQSKPASAQALSSRQGGFNQPL